MPGLSINETDQLTALVVFKLLKNVDCIVGVHIFNDVCRFLGVKFGKIDADILLQIGEDIRYSINAKHAIEPFSLRGQKRR